MWASNDKDTRWNDSAAKFNFAPVDHVEITAAARRMQAEEMARLYRAIGRGFKAAFRAVVAPFKVWRDYQDTYSELASLDERMLADIGISRSDIPRVAAGLWAPQARMERIVKVGLTPKTSANVNRPQVAA
jgi:uncharacterized protein YjiS (DUF1127 family)